MTSRQIAIHLHLYQPPREVPSLGTVEREPTAAPFHDWNERITYECYRPLTMAHVLDERGHVAAAPNLFERISFNVGPTLHAWLEEHAPDVDAAIRAADAVAVRREGHGHAVAQPYVHAILPLASPRDRDTLVRWGIADFARRFGRRPEGMWLPEAAVDVATLETLAAEGIRFTIVGQHQIARTREMGGAWRRADAGVDASVPYEVRLPSGASITVCAFEGPLSQAAAFDHDLLADGARFAHFLRSALRDDGQPRLLTVATDGETFGHHHRFGDMALARALLSLEHDPTLAVAGIGSFIADHPPTSEAELIVPSAWSCAHGVERWRSDCGDSTGGGPGWNQAWRAPLRDALDWLGDQLAEVFEAEGGRFLADPWRTRDDYAGVFGAAPAARVAFVQDHALEALAPLDPAAVRRCLVLLEMQRHLLLAFSSCGWFFNDCAGLETILILRQAAYAMELAARSSGVDLVAGFLERIATMRSNDPAEGDGRTIWERHVWRTLVGPDRLAAWWLALATADPPRTRAGDHRLEGEVTVTRSGNDVLATGTVEVGNPLTLDVSVWSGAALARADGRLVGGVAPSVAGAGPDWPVSFGTDGADGATSWIHDRYGSGCFDLVSLPLEVRARVVEARIADCLRAEESPSVDALQRCRIAVEVAQLDLETSAWRKLLVRAVDTLAAAVMAAPVRTLPDLAWVLGVLRGDVPEDTRWRAQNAVLVARDRCRLEQRAAALAGDRQALAWADALQAVAGLVGVALPPTDD